MFHKASGPPPLREVKSTDMCHQSCIFFTIIQAWALPHYETGGIDVGKAVNHLFPDLLLQVGNKAVMRHVYKEAMSKHLVKTMVDEDTPQSDVRCCHDEMS